MTNTFETQAQQCQANGNVFQVEKPCNGSNASVALSSEAPTVFDFNLADISGMQIIDGGMLLISFVTGETLTVENFAEATNNSPYQDIALADGETINLQKLAEGISSPADAMDMVDVAENETIGDLVEELASIEPVAGDEFTNVITKSNEYDLVVGETYIAEFSQEDIANAQLNENGDLVVSFADETETLLKNFKEVESADDIPTMTLADGSVIPVTDLLTDIVAINEVADESGDAVVAAAQPAPKPTAPVQNTIEQDIAQSRPEELANISPASGDGSDLAGIEPAAGDTAAAGALGNTGANFGSSVSDIGLNNVTPIGPIGVTSLSFDRPTFEDDDFLFQTSPVPPVVTVNNVQGFEDGAINFGVAAAPSNPENCIEVVVSDIPLGWTPDLTDPTTASGTFDPAAGTWTITLPVGATLTSGPVFVTPKDSDEDITPVSVQVTEKDDFTGEVFGVTNATFDVIVDAVADDITLTANNVSAPEDTPANLDLDAVLQDVDGSEEITEILICNVPAGFALSSGTEVTPGNWLVSEADLATLQMTPPANYSGTVSLEIKVTNEEVNFSDSEFDLTNNTNVTTLPFDVTFTPVADAPTLEVGDVRVKEDGNVDLPIQAQLTDPSETLTIRVQNLDNTWGVAIGTNNGVYDAATGTWEITLPAGQNYDGSINLTPPADTDGDMPNILVQAISTESNGTIAQTSDTVSVITDAVADLPTLSATDVTGTSGVPYPLNIANAVTDTDGSESLGPVTISGIPAGFTLTAGTEVSPGVWEVPQADLSGLAINTPAGYQGGFALTIEVTATDTPTDTEYDFSDNTATQVIDLNVDLKIGDANPPSVQIEGTNQVLEDGSITIPFSAKLAANALPTEVLTVTLSGIDSSWTIQNADGVYDAVAGTWTITMPAGQDYTGGLTFTPPADSDVDMTGLVLSATATQPANGSTQTTNANAQIIVDAVADLPDVGAGADKSVEAGQAVKLDLSNALTDTDGSESLGVVTIAGLPAGYSLSVGTQVSAGVWEVAQADLGNVFLNTPVNGNGNVTLSVSTTSTESVTDADFDLTNNTATNTDTVTIAVNPDNNPPEVTFGANGSGQGEVLEDGSVFVPITATLSGNAPQVLTVEVSNIPSTWTIANADGVYNQATGTWTITLPEGQNYDGGLTFTPPADSDVDLTGLVVKATSLTTSNNEEQSSSTSGAVIVDAVADMPNLDAGSDKSVDAGASVKLDLSNALTDTDGSESLGVVTIAGLPAGYSLSVGTQVSAGVWEVAQADLGNVFLNTPANANDRQFELTVAVTSTEAISDDEIRTDNNTATNVDSIKINVIADDEPELANPTPLTVDETDLNPTDTDSNVLQGDFGRDAPGTYEVRDANTFSFTGADNNQLTSGGEPVNVRVVGNSFVGETTSGEEIFRLDVNQTTGQYEFTLKGTLDHADETNPDDVIELKFGVSAKDEDGDVDNGTIVVNVKDDAPFANDDCNSFAVEPTGQDYNIAMILDVSGSMTGDKLALLKSSVSNLFQDFGNYMGGDIKVHITPFAADSQASGTFTVTNGAELTDALAFIDTLTAAGTTNYEAPLASTIDWLNGATANDPINGAETITYFVSDGEPRSYIDASGNVVRGTVAEIIGEITGSDGSNEVEAIQNLSDRVIGVGISVNAGTLANLDLIDSNGNALDVQDPNDLDATFQATNPLAGKAIGNVITGENGGANAADDLSQDVENVVTQIGFGTVIVNVDPVNGATIDGDYGTLKINADGSYEYRITSNDITGNILEDFTYVVTDADGDTSSASLKLKGEYEPVQLPPEVTFGANGSGEAQVLEDGSIFVPITATLRGDAPQALTVTVEGIDSSWTVTTGANNGTYNATTGTWTITLPAGENYNDGLTFKPADDSDVDLTGLVVSATSRNTTTNDTQSSNTSGQIIVDAVADAPNLNAGSDKSVQAGQSIALDVAASLNDTDGSETLSVITIAGVPAGYSLTAGTEVSAGVWEVAKADLNGLRLNTPANGNGSFELTVVVNAVESVTDGEFRTDNNTAQAVDSLKVTVNPDNNPPEVTFGANGSGQGEVLEDGSVFVPITATLSGNAPQVLTVEVSGIPSTWGIGNTDGTYNAASGTWTITLPEGQNYDGGLTFTPPADSDVDLTGLVVKATSLTTSNNEEQSSTTSGAVIVDAVADTPDVDAGSNKSVTAGGSVALDVTNALTDTDGSETLGNVIISGVPADYSLNNGVRLPNGDYELTQADLNNLRLNTPVNGNGALNLTVTATSTEQVTDGETRTDNNVATNSDTVRINVNPDTQPPQVTFGANGSGEAQVLEDGSVFAPITATLSGDAPQVLTVEVSGIPSTWGIGNTDGTYNATSGTWTITLPEGQNYDGGLTFTPPADSDVDLTGLVVKATSKTVSDNSEESSSTSGAIIVDAVADMPNLDAGANKSVDAGASVALDISASLSDTDGSETLSVVTISGLTNGYSLNRGTEVSPGVWEVSQSDLGGLRLNTPNNGSGNVTLNISVMSTEDVTDGEFRTDNNKATNTDTLVISVVPEENDIPIVQDDERTIDETSLVTGSIVENGQVSANFGVDGPGSFAADGRFASSGAKDNNVLSHNGVEVVVTRVGNTYTGKAGAVDVFTMEINADGTYKFTLIENLDHSNPNADNEIINLQFGFDAIDNDNDRADGNIIISVKDDVPFINNKAKPIDESGLDNNTSISYTHTLVHSYGQDGQGSIKPKGDFVAKFQENGTGVNITSNGQPISVTQTDNGYVGKIGTLTAFTLVVANSGQYTYTQYEPIDHPIANNPNDVIWLRFPVEITDFDGDSDTAYIIVDVADSAPTAINDTTQVSESQSVDGNVLGNDKLNADMPVIVSSVNGDAVGVDDTMFTGQFGVLTIKADGSYTYTAYNNNPDGVDEFTYSITDADGDTSTAKLSVRVSPQNDKPDIADPEPVISRESTLGSPNVIEGTVMAEFGTDGPGEFCVPTGTAGFSATGAMSNGTLTWNGQMVTVSGNAAGDMYQGKVGNTVIFQLSVSEDGDYQFTQFKPLDHASATNPDEIINLNFDIVAKDSDGDIAVTTLTVRAVDTGPSAYDDAVTLWSCDYAAIGNVITNYNQDGNGADRRSVEGPTTVQSITYAGKTHMFTESAGAMAFETEFGIMYMFKDGSYTYISEQSLPKASHAEQFTYTIKDGDGDISSATLNLKVREVEVTQNDAADYNNNILGDNTVIDGQAAYKTDITDGAMMYGFRDDDVMSGNVGNDFIYGNAGNDTLYGDAGNDVLMGDSGNNTLHGGDGSDLFEILASKSRNSEFDTIMDFDLNEGDVLSLVDVIDGFTSNDDINDFVKIRFEGSTAVVQVNADGSGTDFFDVAKIRSHNDLDAKTLNVEDLFDKGHIDVY